MIFALLFLLLLPLLVATLPIPRANPRIRHIAAQWQTTSELDSPSLTDSVESALPSVHVVLPCLSCSEDETDAYFVSRIDHVLPRQACPISDLPT